MSICLSLLDAADKARLFARSVYGFKHNILDKICKTGKQTWGELCEIIGRLVKNIQNINVKK